MNIAILIFGAIAFGMAIHKYIAIPDSSWDGHAINAAAALLIGHCIHASLWLVVGLTFGWTTDKSVVWSLGFWVGFGTVGIVYMRVVRRKWQELLMEESRKATKEL